LRKAGQKNPTATAPHKSFTVTWKKNSVLEMRESRIVTMTLSRAVPSALDVLPSTD